MKGNPAEWYYCTCS